VAVDVTAVAPDVLLPHGIQQERGAVAHTHGDEPWERERCGHTHSRKGVAEKGAETRLREADKRQHTEKRKNGKDGRCRTLCERSVRDGDARADGGAPLSTPVGRRQPDAQQQFRADDAENHRDLRVGDSRKDGNADSRPGYERRQYSGAIAGQSADENPDDDDQRGAFHGARDSSRRHAFTERAKGRFDQRVFQDWFVPSGCVVEAQVPEGAGPERLRRGGRIVALVGIEGRR
jgi:hypothetical protein